MASSGDQGAAAAADAAHFAARSEPAAMAATVVLDAVPLSSMAPAAAAGVDIPSSSSVPPTTAAAEAAVDLEDSDDELAADEEEVTDLGSRYWLPSCMTEAYVKELSDSGFLPSKADCQWRIPGDEVVPAPQDGERVVLASHLLRGMGLPPSAFFSAVLRHYGLQPHNIAPNSILVLAGFQALCEGYLGIEPTVELFKYCFLCRRQTIADGQLATCGSITFNCRQGSWYPKIPYIESVKHWTSTFFYCKDIPAPGQQVGIPPFVNGPPTYADHWTEKAATNLPEEQRRAYRRIEFLTKTMEPPRLDGVDTVVCWLSRKIMPLSHRPLKMCAWQADSPNDNMLEEHALQYRLRALVPHHKLKAAEGVPMFTHNNPPPEVRRQPFVESSCRLLRVYLTKLDRCS